MGQFPGEPVTPRVGSLVTERLISSYAGDGYCVAHAWPLSFSRHGLRHRYIGGVKTLSVCPVEDIAAPLEEIWSWLVDPGKLDLWWDAKLQRVRPVGTMVPGQVIDAAPQGFFKKLHIGLAVKEVDHAQHRLSLVASLPLGITDHVTISCMSLGENRSRVSFG